MIEEVRVPVTRWAWLGAGKPAVRPRMGVARVRRMAWVPSGEGKYLPGWLVVWRRRAVARLVPVEVGEVLRWRIVMVGETGHLLNAFGEPVEYGCRSNAATWAVWEASGALAEALGRA